MPMDADALSLRRLLDLQYEDNELHRLTERRGALPEAQKLGERREALEELRNDLTAARKQLEEVAREQARLEGEIEILGGKLSKEEGRLFSGAVSNPKELSSLQAEVEMLKRRRGGLEDSLLEVMVHNDDAAGTVARLEAEESTTSLEVESLTATVGALTSEIDKALGEHSTQRSEIVSEIPADLLSLYETIRAQKHGVGAAALVGDTCGGCHTALPAREVERLRASEGLQRCDNCRRILVVS